MYGAAGIAACFAFLIAFLMEIFAISKGNVTYVTFALIGLFALALHLTLWWHRGRVVA